MITKMNGNTGYSKIQHLLLLCSIVKGVGGWGQVHRQGTFRQGALSENVGAPAVDLGGGLAHGVAARAGQPVDNKGLHLLCGGGAPRRAEDGDEKHAEADAEQNESNDQRRRDRGVKVGRGARKGDLVDGLEQRLGAALPSAHDLVLSAGGPLDDKGGRGPVAGQLRTCRHSLAVARADSDRPGAQRVEVCRADARGLLAVLDAGDVEGGVDCRQGGPHRRKAVAEQRLARVAAHDKGDLASGAAEGLLRQGDGVEGDGSHGVGRLHAADGEDGAARGVDRGRAAAQHKRVCQDVDAEPGRQGRQLRGKDGHVHAVHAAVGPGAAGRRRMAVAALQAEELVGLGNNLRGHGLHGVLADYRTEQCSYHQ
eukprot:m.77667 g.77667  ORF g.77667 m.77667 type:complete len:368 (+) comp14711_c0_seq1:173-1276(+)